MAIELPIGTDDGHGCDERMRFSREEFKLIHGGFF